MKNDWKVGDKFIHSTRNTIHTITKIDEGPYCLRYWAVFERNGEKCELWTEDKQMLRPTKLHEALS